MGLDLDLLPTELIGRLQSRVSETADLVDSLRDEITALHAKRDRLVEEQDGLRGRVGELEAEVARLRHLEHESAEVRRRQVSLFEHVQGLLDLLHGQN